VKTDSMIPSGPLVKHRARLHPRFSALAGAGVFAVVSMFEPIPASAQYKQVNLISDAAAMASHTDGNLLDPWGMAELPGGGFIVADALSGVVTFYSPDGRTLRPPVTVPAAPGLPPGTPGSPSGLAANSTRQFVISKNGKSAPALYLFSTLDGLICGWNPAVDADNAIVIVDNSNLSPFPASYTDLTMARNKLGQMVIFATDSGVSATQSNNDVEIYDGNFQLLRRFTDHSVRSDLTAYSARIVNGHVYVTYAGFTPLDGGVVDVFDTEGNMLRRFAASLPGGPLEAPWEAIIAPEGFGWASRQLLIGEVDSGEISVFSPETGAYLGPLTDAHGKPIVIDGVWALIFTGGTGEGGFPRLYFAAGCAFPPEYTPSLFGYITSANAGGKSDEVSAGALPISPARSKTRISRREN
jgi:uncharacterized protein (TIGR03118 family)